MPSRTNSSSTQMSAEHEEVQIEDDSDMPSLPLIHRTAMPPDLAARRRQLLKHLRDGADHVPAMVDGTITTLVDKQLAWLCLPVHIWTAELQAIVYGLEISD
jgi:hypothetical protein